MFVCAGGARVPGAAQPVQSHWGQSSAHVVPVPIHLVPAATDELHQHRRGGPSQPPPLQDHQA